MNDQIKFDKYHGCGNDFVIIFGTPLSHHQLQKLSKSVLDRHFGIGGDQLLHIHESDTGDFAVSIYNSDGSLAGMCGNGMRAVAHYLKTHQFILSTKKDISLKVGERIIHCLFNDNKDYITVDMGSPSFNAEEIPFKVSGEVKDFPISIDLPNGTTLNFKIHAVSMGNPHCVIFTPDLSKIDLTTVGPLIENHPLFPERTNVEFVQILSPQRLKVLVWERGAGATLACGSGACASLVAAVRAGLCESKATVILPGGELSIHWDVNTNKNTVYLFGPAEQVASGIFSESFLSRVFSD